MKNIGKFIKWFAGFFEDGTGAASSKRGTLYIALFFLFMIVRNSLDAVPNAITGVLQAKPIDLNVLVLVGVIVLFALGAITGENVATIWGTKFNSDTNTLNDGKETN